MGNVSSSAKAKSAVHAFNGDITRQDIVENTASVLEHLVCAPVSVTFKAIHCQEQEHDQRRCGIFIAGKIFANTVCKKLSNLLIFSTNFTTCPPASVNQLFIDGVRNIPKLECIELIGCTFSTFSLHALISGLTARPTLTHLLFRGCLGMADSLSPSITSILSDPAQVALCHLSLTSCDISEEGLRLLGGVMAHNPHFRTSTFKYAPLEGIPHTDDALIAAFVHILPLVENFHLLNCEAITSDRVANALIGIIKTVPFPRNFKLDLCSLGFSTDKYQEILYTLAESTITKLQLALPKGGVDAGVFDSSVRALMECKNVEWLNMYIHEPGHFHSTTPMHMCTAIASSLVSQQCKVRAARFPAMDEEGTDLILEALTQNTSIQHLCIGHNIAASFYPKLAQMLSQKQNITLCRFQPIPRGFDSIGNYLRRNEANYVRRMASLTQICFLLIDQNITLKKQARIELPKDLHAKMHQFIGWKAKRDKGYGSISGNYWESNPSDLDWSPP